MKQDKVAEFENVDEVIEAIKKQKPNLKQKQEWRTALLNSLTLEHISTHFLELFQAKIFSLEDSKKIFGTIKSDVISFKKITRIWFLLQIKEDL